MKIILGAVIRRRIPEFLPGRSGAIQNAAALRLAKSRIDCFHAGINRANKTLQIAIALFSATFPALSYGFTGKALLQILPQAQSRQGKSDVLHHQLFELSTALFDGALIIFDLLELLLKQGLRARTKAGQLAGQMLALFLELGERWFNLCVALGFLVMLECELMAVQLQLFNGLVRDVRRVLAPDLCIGPQILCQRLEDRNAEQSFDARADLR